jgi:hypothetical protein
MRENGETIMLNEQRRHWSPGLLLTVIALGSVGMGCERHSEEALTWCGPATAQMIIENDTKSGCPTSVLQEDLWAIIEAERVDANWDTDPVGMQKALKRSCTSWSWMPIAKTDEAVFMHNVAYFMQHYEYPAAVVIDTLPHNSHSAHAEHWVDVIGAGTTPAATLPTTTPVTVDWVIYVDPAPPAFGDQAILDVVSGSTWFTRLQPVNKPASAAYHGKYVAVVEPPETTGRAVARREPLIGSIRPAASVAEMALGHVKRLAAEPRVAEAMKKYDLARVLKAYDLPEASVTANLSKARALAPMLVNRGGGAYYLVPLTFEGAASAGQAQAAVAINAYDGSFQELGLFRATRYLSRDQLIASARKHPELAKVAAVDAELVYAATAPTAHKLMPLWRVKGDGRTFDFDAQGNELRVKAPLAVSPDVTRAPVRPVPSPR